MNTLAEQYSIWRDDQNRWAVIRLTNALRVKYNSEYSTNDHSDTIPLTLEEATELEAEMKRRNWYSREAIFSIRSFDFIQNHRSALQEEQKDKRRRLEHAMKYL